MQATARNIRPYDPGRDAEAVYTLWYKTLDTTWPLAPERFYQILEAPGAQHFVAEEQQQVVGFAGTARDQQAGHLLILLVDPQQQRLGLGSTLQQAALEHFRASGLQSVQLGGLSPRFWCGVPENLPLARAFFARHGWDFSHTVHDLTQDLSQYLPLETIYQRMEQEQITLQAARSEEVAELLAFEQREFPEWVMHYELAAHLGDYQDMLIARQANEEIMGTLLMYTPQSHPARPDLVWQRLVGEDGGAMGAVGVAETARGRGIGLALVVYGSDILKARGVGHCQIDWVVLTDFYARAGYRVWRSYTMSQRTL